MAEVNVKYYQVPTDWDYPARKDGAPAPSDNPDFMEMPEDWDYRGSLSAASGPIPYKYEEDRILNEIKAYVDATYGQHYSRNKYQATEFIIDSGHGTGFCVGNVLKYAQRYGKKGAPSDARKDMLKVIHYAMMQLYIHDMEHRNETD